MVLTGPQLGGFKKVIHPRKIRVHLNTADKKKQQELLHEV